MGVELVPAITKAGFRANEVKITATDVTTGEIIERNLKISLREDYLGIWLEGTDEFGDPQGIVLLSRFGKIQLENEIAKQPKSWEEENEQKTTYSRLREPAAVNRNSTIG